jgi:hypothetical protein
MNKIIAKNQEGKGLLPTKQSEELERLKSEEQQNTELCNFIKNAFCINGDVSLIQSETPFKSNLWFLAQDKERGNIAIAFKKIND